MERDKEMQELCDSKMPKDTAVENCKEEARLKEGKEVKDESEEV